MQRIFQDHVDGFHNIFGHLRGTGQSYPSAPSLTQLWVNWKDANENYRKHMVEVPFNKEMLDQAHRQCSSVIADIASQFGADTLQEAITWSQGKITKTPKQTTTGILFHIEDVHVGIAHGQYYPGDARGRGAYARWSVYPRDFLAAKKSSYEATQRQMVLLTDSQRTAKNGVLWLKDNQDEMITQSKKALVERMLLHI